jgi:hypothetical protein
MDGEIYTQIRNTEEDKLNSNTSLEDLLNLKKVKEKKVTDNKEDDAKRVCKDSSTNAKSSQARQITSYNLHAFVSKEEFNNTLNVSFYL